MKKLDFVINGEKDAKFEFDEIVSLNGEMISKKAVLGIVNEETELNGIDEQSSSILHSESDTP